MQYRVYLKMSPHESLHWIKPDISKCQLFGTKCFIYVREGQHLNRKFDARGKLRSSCVFFIPGSPHLTFVSTNNVTFRSNCPRAKDSLEFIDNGETLWNSTGLHDCGQCLQYFRQIDGPTCVSYFCQCSKYFVVSKKMQSTSLSSGCLCNPSH